MFTQRKSPPTLVDKRAQSNAVAAHINTTDEEWPTCTVCGEEFSPRRKAIGHDTCLKHGEQKRNFAVVPVPKSNYVVATSIEQVKSPYSHKGVR